MERSDGFTSPAVGEQLVNIKLLFVVLLTGITNITVILIG